MTEALRPDELSVPRNAHDGDDVVGHTDLQGQRASLYEVSSRDLKRVEALRLSILSDPRMSFPDHVWEAMANMLHVNPADPLVRRKWKGRRPSTRVLTRFGVNLLNRVAPDDLSRVRVEALSLAAGAVGEAMELLIRMVRNPPVGQHMAAGFNASMKAALEILKIAGVTQDNPSVAMMLINQQIAGVEGKGRGDLITEEQMVLVEQARQQIHASLYAHGDPADDSTPRGGGNGVPVVDYDEA